MLSCWMRTMRRGWKDTGMYDQGALNTGGDASEQIHRRSRFMTTSARQWRRWNQDPSSTSIVSFHNAKSRLNESSRNLCRPCLVILTRTSPSEMDIRNVRAFHQTQTPFPSLKPNAVSSNLMHGMLAVKTPSPQMSKASNRGLAFTAMVR